MAVSASSGADSAKTYKVTVGDDFFAPTDLKVKKGNSVKWVWLDTNTDTHNVVLTSKHPKGVKKGDFRSSSGSVQITFKKKFKVPGTYGFVCTFHKSEMKIELKVKR